MTDREKLIKLLDEAHDAYYAKCDFSKGYMATLADYLLANGVTFAADTNDGCKWISVEERLPPESQMYIVAANDGRFRRVTFVKWQKRNRMWELAGARSYWKITHWMPLPTPPLDTTNQAADL